MTLIDSAIPIHSLILWSKHNMMFILIAFIMLPNSCPSCCDLTSSNHHTYVRTYLSNSTLTLLDSNADNIVKLWTKKSVFSCYSFYSLLSTFVSLLTLSNPSTNYSPSVYYIRVSTTIYILSFESLTRHS